MVKAIVWILLIDEKVIIEIKSVVELLPVHFKQLLTYLKLRELRYGYFDKL